MPDIQVRVMVRGAADEYDAARKASKLLREDPENLAVEMWKQPNQLSKPTGRLADHLVCEVCQADGLDAADFGGCCHHGDRCDRCQKDQPRRDD